jgi:hypothetical protein
VGGVEVPHDGVPGLVELVGQAGGAGRSVVGR